MSQQPSAQRPVTQICVRILVGGNLLSASDDPLFLGLRGPEGREFRLAFARGPFLRRGQEDTFVLGPADDPDTNVANADLNDPTSPALDARAIQGAYLRKGLAPIPNARGLGELDDRIEIAEVGIDIYAQGEVKPLRYGRSGPIWLGLACGLVFEVPRIDLPT